MTSDEMATLGVNGGPRVPGTKYSVNCWQSARASQHPRVPGTRYSVLGTTHSDSSRNQKTTRQILGLVLSGFIIIFPGDGSAQEDDEPKTAKSGLQALNDFIGEWQGTGSPDTDRRPAGRDLWRESISWSWKFKGEAAWLVMNVKNGRHFKSGELRYDPDKRLYKFTLVDIQDQKLDFTGPLKDNYLSLERQNSKTKETYRLTMNSAGDGVRFIYRYAHKPSGRTLYVKDFQVACTKRGENLARQERKMECVVSGGLGTAAVSFKGMTYYVCCSGCRDAFNENPEKYVKEFEARQKSKKP